MKRYILQKYMLCEIKETYLHIVQSDNERKILKKIQIFRDF